MICIMLFLNGVLHGQSLQFVLVFNFTNMHAMSYGSDYVLCSCKINIGEPVVCSVSRWSGYPASSLRLDRKNGSVRLQTCPKTQPGAFWRAKSVPVPVNPQVLPCSTRPVGSSLRFSFSGLSICGRSHICYCYVQNINFGTSFSLLVSLAAFILGTRRDMLTATS